MTNMTKRKGMFIGNQVRAMYRDDVEDMYRYNAYIEALPPVYPLTEVANRIRRYPSYDENQRLFSPERRVQLVQSLDSYIEPMPTHLDLAQKFSGMIRHGYLARNPLSAEWEKQMRSAFPTLSWGAEGEDYKPLIRTNTNGFCIIGTSGVGKSTAVESILSLYPQVIVHSAYSNQPFIQKQLVWLKLECPFDGSIKQLCLNFFEGVDVVLETGWYKKLGKNNRSTDELLPDMAMLAAELGLGVLVIDEIQRLSGAKSGGVNKMLNFFVQLANTIGVPVVLVGTFKALPFLRGELAQTRRGAGQGDIVWSNFSNDDEFWDLFVEQLWRYQWTNVPTKLTESLNQALYNESQGITDFAVKIYKLAQWYAIGQADEQITPAHIRLVARENLRLAQPILEALRRKDFEELVKIPDLPVDESLDEFFRNTVRRITVNGILQTVRNQHKSEQQTFIEEGDASQLLHVAEWLVQAGISPDIAQASATKAIDRSGNARDLATVRQDAFDIAKATLQQVKQERPKKSKKKREIPYSEQDLRGIWVKAQAAKVSTYDLLVEAGIIRSDVEFIGGV